MPEDEKAFLQEYTIDKLKTTSEQMRKFEIYKRSLDARNKPDIFYVYSVRFLSDIEENILKKNKHNKNLRQVKKPVMYESRLTQIKAADDQRVVIVGSGPAGLFCAYALSLRGVRPVLIERGAPMEERVSEVEHFWKTGELDEEVNVCFGEGGAGTFSDGKLNSGVKDREGTKRFILETFVRFGAGRDILYDAKPHIGTDVLRSVIVNMRRSMEKAGVAFFFHTKFVGVEKKGDRVSGVWVKQGELRDTIECSYLVLAIRHSARNTFEKLMEQRIEMKPKAFAVGVRVQHRQADIDMAQYGSDSRDVFDGLSDDDFEGGISAAEYGKRSVLPAAYYKLTGKTSDGKGVYSFCMCPGGYVVNASSEEGHLVVNGMSDVARDSGYANAAIVVTVNPAGDVFAGLRYQRRLEQAMYKVADGQIPVQRYAEFRGNSSLFLDAYNESDAQKKLESFRMPELSSNQPSVKGRWTYADVAGALPDDIRQAVCEAIDQFGRKIRGFDADDTLILGIESRTSSPVRIIRDEENLESVSLPGLYPCGEGAGYAGGILSAAMDGLRVAERIGASIDRA
ncbi:MAG: FAD-dependent monooxygenase [Eubacterium sp.]|nr:FAD-dependent monooxygenase [Eubacterium sp.]